MRTTLTCLSIVTLTFVTLTLSAQAHACSVASPPMQEMIKEIAAGGVMISGAIVRSVDAKNKQPEIIEASDIFIGNPDQREFVISRSDREYEMLLNRPRTGCGARRLPPADVAFARMILMPVVADGTRNAGWRVHDFFPIDDSKYLDMLFDEAALNGRLQGRPPPIVKYWWNAKDPSLPLPKMTRP